jgi:hypothetical protein
MNLYEHKKSLKYMCFTAHVLFLALNVFFSRTTLPLAI